MKNRANCRALHVLHSVSLNERGFAIVVSMVIILVISLLAVAAMRASVSERWLSGNYASTKAAFASAEAGIYDGVARLRANNIQDTAPSSTTWTSPATTSPDFQNSFSIKHLVKNGNTVIDFAGKPYYVITSTGYDSSARRAQKTIEAIVTLSGSYFEAGMTGCDGVTANGTPVTDSFSSDRGPYNATTNVGSNSTVATCNAGANISLAGNPDINGSVAATGNVVVTGSPTVTGQIVNGAPTSICDPANVSALVAAKAPASPPSTKLKLNNGDVQNIGAGTYYYQEITMSSGSTINVTGPGETILYISNNLTQTGGDIIVAPGATLKIYTPGTIDLSGNGISNQDLVGSTTVIGSPTKVRIFSSSTDTSSNGAVKVAGGAKLAGSVYAPKGLIKLAGSEQLYGAVRGKYVDTLGTNQFHYDEALGKMPMDNFDGFNIVSWREVIN
jgi:Tfp pilus assembly protein PilX